MTLFRWLSAGIAVAISLANTVAAQQTGQLPPAMLRRPVAIVTTSGGKTALVANRASGSISVINLDSRRVIAETAIGKHLTSFVAIAQSDLYLATDDEAHELLLVSAAEGKPIEVRQRLPASPYPVAVIVSPDGGQAYVSSLWSRRLTKVQIDLAATVPLVVERQIDLDFPPRCLALLPDRQRLIVADAFTGRLTVVSAVDLAPVTQRSFPGHNVRSMLVTGGGQKLLVAHQMLNDLAHTIRNDVHWGMLMSNDLRWLKIEAVLAGGNELYFGSHMHPLGEAGRGAADPAGIAMSSGGTVVVALAGTDEVALGKETDFSLFRLKVGKRPTAVAITRDDQTALVANTFEDSISIVDLAGREEVAKIKLGEMPKLSLAQRGEELFHDGKLSHDTWMTCASCHPEGHTIGQLNDNFSDLSFGAPKRVLSLLAQGDTAPYAWVGKNPDLATQIKNSIEKTMQFNDEAPADAVQAIAAYLQALRLPPPLADLRGSRNEAAIARGKAVFENRDCARCHAPPNYTTPKTYDVGLKDKEGNTEFNPPSLRGISHREPYFHDNSAATLEEVFLKYGHPSGEKYEPAEIGDLIEFLRSL
ncbi:MAG TPA: cytochrome c peroxidase [Pirellulaceae bacterium]|nr:cytochrome c peroxidase [Pirellulaceae bacterium]